MATKKPAGVSSLAKNSRGIFELNVWVEVGRNKDNTIGHLQHIFQPFSIEHAKDAVSLADAYVAAVAHIYEIDASIVKNLRRAHEAVMNGTQIMSFAQTYLGLPIWEAGLTATVQSNPLEDSLGVISSYQTVHKDVGDIQKPKESSPFIPDAAKSETWIEVLGLNESQAKQFKLNGKRLLIYRFDPAQRFQLENDPDDDVPAYHKCGLPTLPLPPLPGHLKPNQHYVVTELLFTLPVEGSGSVNWRAFVEVETGAVLYLRPFVACVSGKVFLSDPITSGNVLAVSVLLPDIGGPVPRSLKGDYIQVKDVDLPGIPPPTSTGNFDYDLNATPDEFAAVSAYYHCDAWFRRMESMGFDIRSYFAGTAAQPGFPIEVDHLALLRAPDAQTRGNTGNKGCLGFNFGGRDYGGNSVGIVIDPRIVAHEFCHMLLLDRMHSPNFPFAHSAGDSLAAIWYDPGSLAPQRELTFPWLPTLQARLHIRDGRSGWLWGGSEDSGDRKSEQILSTTLFHFYCMTGGDSNVLPIQKAAARKAVYLIIYGISLLAPSTISAPLIVDGLATALMEADTKGPMLDNVPGGCVHKVIRWSFERQGLYQPNGTSKPHMGPGAPPPVDVFINDGRDGKYEPYLADIFHAPDIWNQNTSTLIGNPTHQIPILGTTNYLFVRVQNRGTQAATNVVVRAYRCSAPTMRWPADWQSLAPSSISVPNLASGDSKVVGPFAWTPTVTNETVLASVSTVGDWSNADPASGLPSAIGPTPIDQLVPFDNNIAMRAMLAGTRPPAPGNVRVDFDKESLVPKTRLPRPRPPRRKRRPPRPSPRPGPRNQKRLKSRKKSR